MARKRDLMRSAGLFAGLEWLALLGPLAAAGLQPSFPLSASLEPPVEGGGLQDYSAEQQFLTAATNLKDELSALAVQNQPGGAVASEERLQKTMDDFLLSLFPVFVQVQTETPAFAQKVTSAWRELRKVVSASASEEPTARYSVLTEILLDLKLPPVAGPTVTNLADAQTIELLRGMSFLSASMIKVHCWILRLERLERKIRRIAIPQHWLHVVKEDLNSILRISETCRGYHERYLQLRRQAQPTINSYLVLDEALKRLQRSIYLGFLPNSFQHRLIVLQQSRFVFESQEILRALQSCIDSDYWKEISFLSTFEERSKALRGDVLVWGTFMTHFAPVVWKDLPPSALPPLENGVPISQDQEKILEAGIMQAARLLNNPEMTAWRGAASQFLPGPELIRAGESGAELLLTYDLDQLSASIHGWLEVLRRSLRYFKDYIQILFCVGRLYWQKISIPHTIFSNINRAVKLLTRLESELAFAVFHDQNLKARVDWFVTSSRQHYDEILNDIKAIPSLVLAEPKPEFPQLRAAYVPHEGQPASAFSQSLLLL